MLPDLREVASEGQEVTHMLLLNFLLVQLKKFDYSGCSDTAYCLVLTIRLIIRQTIQTSSRIVTDSIRRIRLVTM